MFTKVKVIKKGMQNQLFLLNFYKLLSNVATKLVGAFIPIIILDATGSVALACISVVASYLIRLAFSVCFKKLYEHCPQLILLIRLAPFVLYTLSIFLMETNLWLGIIGVVLFYGISESFKCMPIEILYNYASTTEESGNSLGVTRLLEQAGVLIALVVGGVMLDVNKNLILIISVVLYLISVVPLLIYYIKGRKLKGFNTDAVSNAVITFSKDPEMIENARQISKKMLLGYWFVYFIFSFMDIINTAFVIHLYLTFPSFGMAGYVNALFNAMFGIGCFLFGLLDNKKETTPVLIVACIVCMIGVACLIFVTNTALLFVVTGLTGLFYGCISTFCLRRLLPKSRIMGISNESLYVREIASNMAVIVPMLLGAVGSMIPVLVLVSAGIGASAYLIPANEERSRRLLIDFLQKHEDAMSARENNKKTTKKLKSIKEK